MESKIKDLIMITEEISELNDGNHIYKNNENIDELREIITSIISEFASTYNAPSDWRIIGDNLLKNFKDINNNDIVEKYQLYDYESEE